MSETHLNVDCQRLLCPLPVIRVQDAVATLRPGDLVTAVCTDPGVLADIPAWCRINGHTVLDTRQDDDSYTVTLKTGSPA
jgi:TusA-related sulfurtransferase